MSVSGAVRFQEVLTCSVRLRNSCTALGTSLSIRSCRKVNKQQAPGYILSDGGARADPIQGTPANSSESLKKRHFPVLLGFSTIRHHGE